MTSNYANATPLPPFNVAQLFFIDPALAPNSMTIGVTSINVYFKYKPASNTNSSGITNPGVTLYLANTVFGVPLITSDTLNNYARAEWAGIQTSSDGTAATNFKFVSPIQVQPSHEYALILSFDGNEVFTPWTATTGQWEVGTRVVYSGGPGNLVGDYYEFVNNGNTSPLQATTQAQYQSYWTPLAGTYLTFDVFAARYFVNAVPVAFANLPATTVVTSGSIIETWNANTSTVTYTYPSQTVEAFAFNLSTSQVQSYIGAQRVYQNTFSWPGGYAGGNTSQTAFVSISCNTGNTLVTANSLLPNGSAFNWNNIYPTAVLAGTNMIVLQDISGVNVRKVIGIANTTVIQVDEPITFTNTAAQFQITPCATVSSILQSSPYGLTKNILFCRGSTANSSNRFTDYTIQSANITAGGTGYNNNNILYVTGYEFVAGKLLAGFNAIANLTTNSTGGVTNIFFSNAGARFVNSTSIVTIVANSSSGNNTSNTSNGSGLTVTYTIGSTILTEFTGNQFQNCVVSNFNIDDVFPFFSIHNPAGTTYELTMTSQYYMNVDSASSTGYTFYVEAPVTTPLNLSQLNPLVNANPISFVSFSNEFITPYSNGALNTQVNAIAGFSNGILINVLANPNPINDYEAVIIQSTPTIEFGHYIINNSYYGEETNSGNAWAKHLTTLINFNQFAEDIRVYLTVYQPINTSFQVFARIQNSNDVESFSAEDWSLLTLIAGGGQTSSLSNLTDYVELVYGFPQWPMGNSSLGANSVVTLGNTVATSGNTSVGNVQITTTGGFNTLTGFTNGAVVRVYNKLFQNTEYVVASVVATVSDTAANLDFAFIANTNLVSSASSLANVSGLYLDVLPYGHQAFNNLPNDNVVRYYNTTVQKFDGYNNLQIKVVLNSSQFSYIPQINSIRAIGASA